MTLYYGKCDTVCDYVGGMAMAQSIPHGQQAAFKQAELTAVLAAPGVEVGQVKAAGGLTFYQFESSGHMVPNDKPESAAIAIDSLLSRLLQ